MAKTRKRTGGSKPDVYQMVTDRILAQLEAGTAPWRKPWNTSVGRPQNLEGRPYRGVNVLLLGLAGYSSPFWMTFKQAKERGGSVKRGEKGTMVVFWKTLQIAEKDETGEPVKKTIPLLRYYTVFNLDQTEGVKLPKRVTDWQAAQANHEHAPVLAAEEVITAYATGGPKIRTDGTSAYYVPETDVITVPPPTAYADGDGDEYYSTLFHEIGHSTGHKSRLDRFTGKGRAFGCHDYGREELVAEMTSAFLQAETGIESAQDNSAAYLAGWIQTIKEDNKAVVVAAGAAQRAADLVLGRNPVAEVEQTNDETVALGNETLERAA